MNFLKKIFSPTILTISFLLLIYIFYKSEIVYSGSNRNYYKIYYLISSILICFSIITFFIKDQVKVYLIISFNSLILSLYLFEGYITLKEQLSKRQLYEKQKSIKWDTRSKLEVYKDLKKKNNNITLSYRPSGFINKNYSLFPLSVVSNSKTIFCNENGYYSIYQSDRYGFNNPDEEWDKEEIEYLLVGDSLTQGACVNRPNDISSVLRDLSKKSVLNLGISRNGPLIEYATLREYLDTNVKKILWIYFEGNDLSDLIIEIKNSFLNKYLKDLNYTQNLKFRQNEINNLIIRNEINNLKSRKIEEKRKNLIKIELKKFIKITNTRSLLLKRSSLAPIPEFKTILELTKELSNKNNSKLYFIYLPEYSRYKKTDDNKNFNLVKNIVTELKIPFIDIHKEVFENEQNPLKLFPFELSGHYNIYGYKKVAETIYKFTKD